MGLRGLYPPLKSSLQRPSYHGRKQGHSVKDNNYLFNSENIQKTLFVELDMEIGRFLIFQS